MYVLPPQQLTNSVEHRLFEKLTVTYPHEIQPFLVPTVSLPYSKETAISLYHETDKSSPHLYTILI
jgi:hypothetical protein